MGHEPLEPVRAAALVGERHGRALDLHEDAIVAGERRERPARPEVRDRERQTNASSPAPGGSTAISVVVPRPFFQGMTR